MYWCTCVLSCLWLLDEFTMEPVLPITSISKQANLKFSYIYIYTNPIV